jgi:hypothetical protein
MCLSASAVTSSPAAACRSSTGETHPFRACTTVTTRAIHSRRSWAQREVEGEVLIRRTVTIVDAELRRVASAQGILSRDPPDLMWRSVDLDKVRLGVAPSAASPIAPHDHELRLGFERHGQRRADGFLPAIAALIDPRQFELISRPSAGIIVVQGSAGSGKTTIGLHRIAYLNFSEPSYFPPQDMLVIVYQRALAAYVSRVLPELQVPGVKVRTFASWSEEVRKATIARLSCGITDTTPPLVMRAKSHGAMLGILADRQAEMACWCRQLLETEIAPGQAREALLVAWDQSKGPVDARVTALARFVKQTAFSPFERTRIEACGMRCASAPAMWSVSGLPCSRIARLLAGAWLRTLPGSIPRAR